MTVERFILYNLYCIITVNEGCRSLLHGCRCSRAGAQPVFLMLRAMFQRIAAFFLFPKKEPGHSIRCFYKATCNTTDNSQKNVL